MFDTLVWHDASSTAIQWLATSWQRSPDGTQWTFTIRDGVKWQDGTPLTASDVAFTYNYLIHGPGQAAAGIFGAVFIGNFKDVAAVGPFIST
jgi:peptide/nickel transport system substrate-binding protein